MAIVSFVLLVVTLVMNGGLPTSYGGLALVAMLALLAFMPRLTLKVLKFALPVVMLVLLLGQLPPAEVGPAFGALLTLGLICFGFFIMLHGLFHG